MGKAKRKKILDLFVFKKKDNSVHNNLEVVARSVLKQAIPSGSVTVFLVGVGSSFGLTRQGQSLGFFDCRLLLAYRYLRPARSEVLAEISLFCVAYPFGLILKAHW